MRWRKAPRIRPHLESMQPRLLLTGDPFAAGGDPSVNPADFRVTAFATGLNFPEGMVSLDDGSLLVGTSRPTTTSEFDSTGQLLRLVDANGDGVADGPGTLLFDGLPGTLTGLRRAGDLFIVTSSEPGHERISLLRAGATPASPLTLAGSLNFAFPANWEHTTYGLAVRALPSAPAGSYQVLFNVGSEHNSGPSGDTVGLSGLLTATLSGNMVYAVTLRDSGGTLQLDPPVPVASGLRNAASLEFDPASGDLFLVDNGIDDEANNNEELSADTLDRVPAAAVGQLVPDFGFPNQYIEYRTGRVVGGGGQLPLVAFQPIPDPQTGSESAGSSGFAAAPPGFPDGLNHGFFIGFHGEFNTAGVPNGENPLVYVDPATGKYFDFVSNDVPIIGHLDGLLSTHDALFAADLVSTGSPFDGAGAGVIYEIRGVGGNNAPTLAAIPDQTVAEGQLVTFQATATDPDPGQTLTYSLDPGAPAGAAIGPHTGVFTWTAPGGAATATITVRVTDNGTPSLSDAKTFTVHVTNVSPTVTLGAAGIVARGVAFTRVGSFADPGADAWTALVNYGDGSGVQPLALRADKTFTLSHTYAKAGPYTVVVMVADEDGGKGLGLLPLRVLPRTPTDYDGDGKADPAVYRPSNGLWQIQTPVGTRLAVLGGPSDIPVQGDFDGDGKSDLSIYRLTTGQWIFQPSGGGPLRVVNFGLRNIDIPVPADYDGDARADIAVYRPTTGQFFILRSTGGLRVVNFGLPNVDRPVPMDYDGDGKTDVAVYRPTTGQWIIQQSSAGLRVQSFGLKNVDVPIPADYDGDGKADLAVYRPTTSQFLLAQSSLGPKVVPFGSVGKDTPLLGDFDGDGRADIAIYRPSTGQFLIRQPTGTTRVIPFGAPILDVPVTTPLAYRYKGSLLRGASVYAARC